MREAKKARKSWVLSTIELEVDITMLETDCLAADTWMPRKRHVSGIASDVYQETMSKATRELCSHCWHIVGWTWHEEWVRLIY
jgi:hypothetical protein